MSTLTLSGAGLSGNGALINSAASTTSALTNGAAGSSWRDRQPLAAQAILRW